MAQDKKKILFSATVISHIIHFHMPYIEYWHMKGYEVHVVTNMNVDQSSNLGKEKSEFIKKKYNYVKWQQVDFHRSPLSKQNFQAYKQIKEILEQNIYEIIHVHTPVASILCRLAARNIKGTKVFYTAHGFHFFKGAPLKNWLIYYPIEKIMSKYTDVLITINQEDFKLASERFYCENIKYIPGIGFDYDKFKNCQIDIETKRQQIGVNPDERVLLSVGELNKNKNHEVIIRAIKKINNKHLRYIIVGKGELDEYLQSLIEELNLTEQVKLLGYRTDIHELCQVCDVFCFPSYREGLGLAAVEALSAGKPIITSTTRGIDDYSIDGVTGFKSKDYSIDGFVQAIQNYLDNRNNFDAELLKKQAERFSEEEVQRIMQQIYMEAVHD